MTSSDNDIDRVLRFETYGVNLRISYPVEDMRSMLMEQAKLAFMGRVDFSDRGNDGEHIEIDVAVGSQQDGFSLVINGEAVSGANDEPVAMQLLRSRLRALVGERCRTKVFIHAGVVSIDDKAIILPGRSYAGKTTLVVELVRRGFTYLSDEYAILDESGMVESFPRRLYLRPRDMASGRKEVSFASIGAKIEAKKCKIGMAVFTEFEPLANGILSPISLGNGIKEIIPHTLPIRNNTKFALKALNNALGRAIILKGTRGEASSFAEYLLGLVNK